MKKSRPILRYHGGKWLLAPWIISHFPDHRIYVEPFGGAASVLLRKERAYAEIYNDQWDVVVNVFRVMRDAEKAYRLRELLELTPFSRTEFVSCGDVDLHGCNDDVEMARRTILRSFCGFGSASTNARYATGFRANSHRSGTTPAHDWVNYPSHIDWFIRRLKGVCIENRPALDVMRQHDSENTLFYVDPPYVHSTRNMQRGNAAYAVEMTDEDHVNLANYLASVKGMAVVSGYQSPLYEELFGSWHRIDRIAHADGARKRTECLWVNQSAFKRMPQAILSEVSA